MIDPDSIDEYSYNSILQALVKSDKFTVVDRGRGWLAVKKEQDRLHSGDESKRYDNKEKWAHWAKLFGVGSVIAANTECQKVASFMSSSRTYLHCKQNIYMVDANTGAVIAAFSGEGDGPSTRGNDYIMPDWVDTVVGLVEAYPKKFNNEHYEQRIIEYQAESLNQAQKAKD